jgi:hypothetical protein
MKISTLLSLLKTMPQDAEFSLCGMTEFFVYEYSDSKKNNIILFDTEHLSSDDFPNSSHPIMVMDTISINEQYKSATARSEKIDEFLMGARALKKMIDKD